MPRPVPPAPLSSGRGIWSFLTRFYTTLIRGLSPPCKITDERAWKIKAAFSIEDFVTYSMIVLSNII
jgi:hypothetical protein